MCIKNLLSYLKSVFAGVPQGSVLGPLLFLIYINDIAENLESLTRLFADDTSLAKSSKHPSEIELTLNQDLKIIEQWSTDWLITFNSEKTNIIFFTTSTDNIDLNVYFNNNKLEIVNTHKHLGITFSPNCKWNSHIDNLISTVSKQISMLRKIKYILNKDLLNKIYLTFIRPTLEYASEL